MLEYGYTIVNCGKSKTMMPVTHMELLVGFLNDIVMECIMARGLTRFESPLIFERNISLIEVVFYALRDIPFQVFKVLVIQQ